VQVPYSIDERSTVKLIVMGTRVLVGSGVNVAVAVADGVGVSVGVSVAVSWAGGAAN